MNEDLCPICKQPSVKTCRCPRGDSTCKNGHAWHTCVKHNRIVLGGSDHSIPTDQCTCPIEVTIKIFKDPPDDEETYCENCNKNFLEGDKPIYLELDRYTNLFHLEGILHPSISIGKFPFHTYCANNVLHNGGKKFN